MYTPAGQSIVLQPLGRKVSGMNIPIKALRELSKKYGYDHIICFATKGKMQYVATYGNTIQACDEAAQFGDKMKDGLGWPESLHAAPSRVRSLQKRVKELEAQLEAVEHSVQRTAGDPPEISVGFVNKMLEEGGGG